MSTTPNLGLPPIPPELKSISPYIQRAEELHTKDPIMSYWCAYYATQTGISLRSPTPASRSYLLSLLTLLESFKASLGSNDAIENEPASVAYVENFGLKVFGVADEEDRAGKATRSTAKKFLAAANFLELLRIFEGAGADHEDKIRYAKWKAANIAKAFREGRKPTPGPAGSGSPIPSVPTNLPSETSPGSTPQPLDTHPASPPTPRQKSTSPPRRSPPNLNTAPGSGSAPSLTRKTPSPNLDSSDIARANITPPRAGLGGNVGRPDSPGSWSTLATPGGEESEDERGRVVFGGSSRGGVTRGSGRGGGVPGSKHPQSGLRKAWVSEDVGAPSSPTSLSPSDAISNTPSSVGVSALSFGGVTQPVTSLHYPGSDVGSGTTTTAVDLDFVAPAAFGKLESPPRASRGIPPSPPTPTNKRLSPPGGGRVVVPIADEPEPGEPVIGSVPLPPASVHEDDSFVHLRAAGDVRSGVGGGGGLGLGGGPSAPPLGGDEDGYGGEFGYGQPYQPSVPNNWAPPPPPAAPYYSPPPSAPQYPSHYSPPPTQPHFPPPPTQPHFPPPPTQPHFPPPPTQPYYSPPHTRAPVPPSPSPPPPDLTPVMIAKAQKHCRFAISALDYEDGETARKELRAALALLGG
ncbi:hypothetical protein JAAARDRAFT_29215 [Jaapia argillacea MUCL 33604]|uniref:Vta1/callose synthase N-terminal domain-containing protein n=1 Tax=Jaapia argillacea MUCL 33604 TaxID=933084 RepID=A0A067Q896_9AGAM|nr:hypothetical protein JAAARDRAFT_29215 [Jaapia argillacea MUCL 33604]